MKYSHVLKVTISQEELVEATLFFHGTFLDMQELELTLNGKIPEENSYQAAVSSIIYAFIKDGPLEDLETTITLELLPNELE